MRDAHQLAHDLIADLDTDAVFCSENGQAFITIPIGAKVHQTFSLHDTIVRDWLAHRFRELHDAPPADAILRLAIRTLRAQAYFDSPRQPVALRVARDQDTVVLDLGDGTGDTVSITPGSWNISSALGQTFRSTRGQHSLPRPAQAKKSRGLQPLRALLNCPDDRNWTRIEHWLFAALKPTGPYPILILHGSPGSGKSTAARMLRTLLDPVTAPLQALPTRERAIEKLAWRHRVLAFDHVTRMSDSATGALCRISTGTGIDLKESGDPRHDPLQVEVARPIILTSPRTGKGDWAPRVDLAARAIPVEMPTLEAPRDPEALWKEFEDLRPTLQGALYTAFAASMDKSTPRRDFETRLEMESSSARADPLFKTLRTFSEEQKEWTGTATDLLNQLALPAASPRALSQRLRDLAITLQTEGVLIEFHRVHAGIRQITLRYTKKREICVTRARPLPGPRISAPNGSSETDKGHHDDKLDSIGT